MYSLQESSISFRFHDIPKQPHQLWTKCLNTWASGGYFIFKSQQIGNYKWDAVHHGGEGMEGGVIAKDLSTNICWQTMLSYLWKQQEKKQC